MQLSLDGLQTSDSLRCFSYIGKDKIFSEGSAVGKGRDLCTWRVCGAISLQALGKTEAFLCQNIEMLTGVQTQVVGVFFNLNQGSSEEGNS